MPPLVAQVLVPLMIHSSAASSYFALVRTAPTSEPAPGSEEQNAANWGSPGVPNICGSHSPICCGVPLAARAAAASPVAMMDNAIPASPQNISSNTVGMPRPLASPAIWANRSGVYSPTLAASWMIGHGVSSRSSHSAAAGRMTVSANSWTQSRTCTTSSDNSNEKVASISAPISVPGLGSPHIQ
jgi:hypothetical protein